MKIVSKSKLIAYRQCPKRLWLEVNKPELKSDSSSTQASFNVGYQVGDVARIILDPKKNGIVLDAQKDGFNEVLQKSKTLLNSAQPIFEAGYSAGGAIAFADAMLPIVKANKLSWRMVEVKSATSVKDYYVADASVQAYIAKKAGVALDSVAIAHIDSSWTYPGKNKYQGLLKLQELTDKDLLSSEEIERWILEAQTVLRSTLVPECKTGDHCYEPYECGYIAYCERDIPVAEHPVAWLPRRGAKLKTHIQENQLIEMSEVADELLNDIQIRVKNCTLNNQTYFDAASAKEELSACGLPAYFLDFETINFAVPIWAGTRPYQQIPFQFSLHKLTRTWKLQHFEFLDISGHDPQRAFAEALVHNCGLTGPVYVYNAAFENARIGELASKFKDLAQGLEAIQNRIVDLLPVARNFYYHPSQEGSWSIKKVLPAVAPELRYDALNEVQDGGMAMDAFLEAISEGTTLDRKAQIYKNLLEYCKLDTFAMVKLWLFFSGSNQKI